MCNKSAAFIFEATKMPQSNLTELHPRTVNNASTMKGMQRLGAKPVITLIIRSNRI